MYLCFFYAFVRQNTFSNYKNYNPFEPHFTTSGFESLNNPVKLKYQIYLNNNITITSVIISVYNFQRQILITRPIRLRKFLIDHY